MDYDFSRLSTRSFEQMIQSISLSILGGGVTIFGDGPDGGREATFEELHNFPSSNSPWKGYGVIQAKFRQRPTQSNSTWAVKELRAELTKLAKVSAGKKPEFYIFVTNVVLSPVAGTGGKDRISTLIDKYKKQIGIKDFRVWDYDQLCSFLDICPAVRNAYRAWITPGDVLAAIISHMKPQTESFREIMLNFVQKELRGEQYVNLGQAGHNSKDRIPLATVFVDLPIKEAGIIKEYGAYLQGEVSNRNEEVIGALAKLNKVSGQLLDGESLSKRQAVLSHGVVRHPGKIVFIGGPGQGKSTLTQFFCQLHRCCFIKQHSLRPLTSEVEEACGLLFSQSKEEGLELPSNARFPLRVELNKFAAALANGACTSLFGFILNRIKDRSERDLSSDDLRCWLANYPWLIALDGLDEVPASSNREQVLESIQDFLIDAAESNADILLVATSRPQGYDDDFSQSTYTHYKLAELDVADALHYAEKLINRRWGDDEDKVQTLLARMQRACKEESTIRLMKSPLQVTIMALLVESLGEPPKERWRLFNEYYQVINRREKERDIPAAKLLNSFQADIDFIHQKVGVYLQVESERSGKTDALLTEDEFSKIISLRLNAEGHDGENGQKFKYAVIEAALERLVFLVAPQEGRIGFEIRSLQEFMAAQAITSGSDEQIASRLRSIAHASHWRNVFLFAAGRCFHERQYLRDNIFTICSELNEGDAREINSGINKVLLIGSELALDIIEDGVISNQPGQLRIFSRLALRLLDLSNVQLLNRLAQIYRAGLEDLYREAINQRLSNRDAKARVGAWHVLISLAESDVGWAVEMADKEWPAKASEAIKISLRNIRNDSSGWLARKWFSAVLEAPPSYVHMHYLPLMGSFMEGDEAKNKIDIPEWYVDFVDLIKERTTDDFGINSLGPEFSFFLSEGLLDKPAIAVSYSDEVGPWWKWVHRCVGMCRNITKEELSEIISDAAYLVREGKFSSIGSWLWCLPWQIACIVEANYSAEELESLARRILNGEMGDTQDWLKASDRWKEKGVLIEDLFYIPSNSLPFDHRISEVGFPACSFNMEFRFADYDPEVIRRLLSIYKDAPPSSSSKKLIASAMNMMLSGIEDSSVISLDVCECLHDIISDAPSEWVDPAMISFLPAQFWSSPNIFKTISSLLKAIDQDGVRSYEAMETKIDMLQKFIEINPQFEDAVILLSRLIVVGRESDFNTSIASIERLPNVRLQEAHIIIMLARKDCTAQEGSQLAELTKIIMGSAPSHNYFNTVLEMLRESVVVTKGTESFLYTLLSNKGYSEDEDRNFIIFLLRKHQKRQLSHDASLLCEELV